MPDFDTLLNGSTLVAFVLTLVLAYFSSRLRHRKSSPITEGIVPKMPERNARLPVQSKDPDLLEMVAISQHVANLVIAEEWTEIADEIANWEQILGATPGGRRYHDVAVMTCLSGLQGLLDEAPRRTLDDLDEAMVEVGHFIDSHSQAPDNHILALLAARAHIAVGEACSPDFWPEDQRKAVWRRMAQHYIAAGRILSAFDARAHISPLLAEAHYLQALGSPGGTARLKELFEDWIDLDPSNSGIYDTHIRAMVARDALTGDDILHEADIALARTEQSLGFGGYALFFMPLLTEYEAARELLDHELYAAALLDLASNNATQSEVNQAAAALLAEIEDADAATAQVLRETLIVLIRQNLTVIYPRLWPMSVSEIQALVSEVEEAAPDVLYDDEDDETHRMTQAA